MISPVIANSHQSALVQADWCEEAGMQIYADAVREMLNAFPSAYVNWGSNNYSGTTSKSWSTSHHLHREVTRYTTFVVEFPPTVSARCISSSETTSGAKTESRSSSNYWLPRPWSNAVLLNRSKISSISESKSGPRSRSGYRASKSSYRFSH